MRKQAVGKKENRLKRTHAFCLLGKRDGLKIGNQPKKQWKGKIIQSFAKL